jgi:hypothetical protein
MPSEALLRLGDGHLIHALAACVLDPGYGLLGFLSLLSPWGRLGHVDGPLVVRIIAQIGQAGPHARLHS